MDEQKGVSFPRSVTWTNAELTEMQRLQETETQQLQTRSKASTLPFLRWPIMTILRHHTTMQATLNLAGSLPTITVDEQATNQVEPFLVKKTRTKALKKK